MKRTMGPVKGLGGLDSNRSSNRLCPKVPDRELTKKQLCYVDKFLSRTILAVTTLVCLTLKTSDRKKVEKDSGLHDTELLVGFRNLMKRGKLEKTVKKFCAWPMARLLGNPLPSQDEDIDYRYLLGNKIRRLINCRCPTGELGKTPTDFQSKVANSFLCLKDAMITVCSDFVAESFSDYMANLSAHPPTAEQYEKRWDDQRERRRKEGRTVPLDDLNAEEIGDRFRASIVLCANEILPQLKPGDMGDYDVIPSVSSSLEGKRPDGGQWQWLVDEALGGDENWIELALPQLVGMYVDNGIAKPIYGRYCALSGEFVFNRRARARVVPVLEACKVRWVSIGESKAYYQAKAWNRVVYRYLSKHDTFCLTGKPLEVEDLYLFHGLNLLSGDYKGATDTLDPEWSEFAFEAITHRLYSRDPQLLERLAGLPSMLTKHELDYKGTIFEQHTGQLMGSYLSFPILCILNAAINRLFLDPELVTPLDELPILVNGDDIIMASDDDFSAWEGIVSMAGLKPSLGKCYVHQKVMCINSEFYQRDHVGDVFENGAAKFRKIEPWRVNLTFAQDSDADGGLFGNHVNRPEFLQLGTLGAMARTLVFGQSDFEKELLLSEFISNNSKTLKSTNRCWWTPEELGGIGLPLDENTVSRVSRTGRCIATYLMTRPEPKDVLLYAARGSPSFTVSCRRWMEECGNIMPALGYEYRFMTDDEMTGEMVQTSPPLRLIDFVGYGSIPFDCDQYDHYSKLVSKVYAANIQDPFIGPKNKNAPLTLCSDEKLIQFARTPRTASWFKSVRRVDRNGCESELTYRCKV